MPTEIHAGTHIVGLDIGGTKTMATVFDSNYQALGRSRKKTVSKKSEEPAQDRIVGVVREALEESGVDRVVAIGAGSPGPLDPETGVIIDTPNLGWKNFPLARHLADEFGVPVYVDNDVNMGTYGEWRFGEVQDCRNVVGIFPGTGIGGGLIINGELFHGFTGAAGEIGHMTIEVNGPYCGCGKRGCLEAVASRVAIAEQVAALAIRDDAPYIKDKCGANLRKIRSGVLAEAVAEGETMVEGVVRKAAYYTGIAVGNLINILSPDAVVLGGGLVEAMEDLYLEEVFRAVQDHAMPFLRQDVRIVAARLGDDAVVMGAAKWAAERLAGRKSA